jgi:hypothetical protein
VVKVRTYGALMGALLTISAIDTAEAATCTCVDRAPRHHVVIERQVPAHIYHQAYDTDTDLEYAQSYYDYHSTSRVGEVFIGRPVEETPPDDGWRVAPHDAHIRFYRDERVIYVPVAPYSRPYPHAYYPPAYYPLPPHGIQLYDESFEGGVGASAEAGAYAGGSSYGQNFVYGGQGSGAALPPNGGGVALPGGYGPTYRGGWQGPVVPTMGGGVNIGR